MIPMAVGFRYHHTSLKPETQHCTLQCICTFHDTNSNGTPHCTKSTKAAAQKVQKGQVLLVVFEGDERGLPPNRWMESDIEIFKNGHIAIFKSVDLSNTTMVERRRERFAAESVDAKTESVDGK